MLKCLEFKAEDFIPVMKEAISNNSELALIKGRGIFFVSVIPTQSKANEFTSKVAFAKGCNPMTDQKWANNCNRLGGGEGNRLRTFSTDDPTLKIIYDKKSNFQIIADGFGIQIIV